MNATEAINELEKRGGVADKDWQGEKLEMKTDEEREQAWAEDQNAEDDQGQKTNDGFDSARFEIEIEDPKSKRQSSPKGLDALQRQRPVAKAVF
jgi:hypothetical protein